MLHYEGGGAKSLEALELETAAQPRTNYRKLDRGAIEPKTLDIACFFPLQSPYFIGVSGAKRGSVAAISLQHGAEKTPRGAGGL